MKKTLIIKFLFLICCGVLINYLGSPRTQGQTCNSQNSPSIYNQGFPPNTTIQVFIAPNVGEPQATTIRNAVTSGFSGWQNTMNAAGISLSFVTTQPTIPPASGVYSWLIGMETPPTSGVRGETGVFYDSNNRVQQAITVIDPRVTNAAAITDVMAHEVGHPLGLDDCLTCSATQSIMSPGNQRSDYWNGLSGRPLSPTGCDSQQLETNYPNQSECPCGDCINGCCNPGVTNCQECPCGDCEFGCGGEEECHWEEVEGQCYGGVAYGDCWDSYGVFNANREGCQSSPPYCDPPQMVWVCPN